MLFSSIAIFICLLNDEIFLSENPMFRRPGSFKKLLAKHRNRNIHYKLVFVDNITIISWSKTYIHVSNNIMLLDKASVE